MAHLVSGLSQAEISAPTRFVAVQTIVMDIQGRVEVSDIDPRLKSQLKTHLTEFDLLLENVIDDLIEMQTIFVSGIDILQIYTEQTLSGILNIMDGREPLFGLKRVGNDTFWLVEIPDCRSPFSGSPETLEEQLSILYDDYLTWIDTEVERILSQALKTQETLSKNREKVKTLGNLFSGGLKVAEDGLDEVQFGSMWARLFGGNKADMARQNRAIENFKDFQRYNQLFGNAVGKVIVEVKQHQATVKNLKAKHKAAGPLVTTLEMYLKQMQSALTSLKESKNDFNKNVQRSKQEQERIESWERECSDDFYPSNFLIVNQEINRNPDYRDRKSVIQAIPVHAIASLQDMCVYTERTVLEGNGVSGRWLSCLHVTESAWHWLILYGNDRHVLLISIQSIEGTNISTIPPCFRRY